MQSHDLEEVSPRPVWLSGRNIPRNEVPNSSLEPCLWNVCGSSFDSTLAGIFWEQIPSFPLPLKKMLYTNSVLSTSSVS